ncbi:MAG: carboxypeptidase M32 [Spirochaetales bacterium]
MSQKNRWNELVAYLAPIADVSGALSLLSWDQETMMPQGGSEPRAHQMGTLSRILHERYTDTRLKDLIDEAKSDVSAETREAYIIRAVERQYVNRTKLPADLVVRRTELSARARESWKAARNADNFELFRPDLEEQVAVAREVAECLGYKDHAYDALIDSFEPGLSYDWISARFDAIRPRLSNLIGRIAGKRREDSNQTEAEAVLVRRVSRNHQLEFGRTMAELVGYKFANGRLDLSAHPFTSGSSYLDVRLTTRVLDTFFPSCLFSCIHEAGHGIHGQNIAPDLYRLPFRYGLALAESQSRFYENVIGRSRVFWEYAFEKMRASVTELSDITLDQWYRGINAVSPSLIRVEADEVTYGMHIMLRFELEFALISGDLKVPDLPAAWNEKMQSYLGIAPESDAKGVLQDIHWSQGAIGYFPDYLLGSMLSSQLWQALQADLPDAETQVRAGSLAEVNAWMRESVQRHGGLYTFAEIAQNATAQPFSAEPYLTYLEEKYWRLYGL